jgi:ribonucleoside-diphosphate reductase alpha chain
MVEQVVEVLPIPTPKAQPLAEAMVHDYIATRRPLPDSCQGGRMKARVGGHTVYLNHSSYEDGRLERLC